MASNEEVRAVTDILRNCAEPVIVDLGSYQGEDAEWMSKACTCKKMIMVEVDSDNFAAVQAVANRIGAKAQWGAIADHDGVCDFWACYTPDGRGSGSIRKPTGHLVEKPWYDFRQLSYKIPCFTLDTLFRVHNLDHIDLLWVDIQGAENSMIAGGKNALEHTRYLFIEAEKRILYDGQVIREDLLAMLPGWTIIGDFDYNLLLRNERI